MGLAKRFLHEEWGSKPIPKHVLRFFGQTPKPEPKEKQMTLFTGDSMVDALIEDTSHVSAGELHEDPYATLTPHERAEMENWFDEQDRLETMDRDAEQDVA